MCPPPSLPLCVCAALQLTTYQERLRFAEQEAAQAQSTAVEKTKMAREVRKGVAVLAG